MMQEPYGQNNHICQIILKSPLDKSANICYNSNVNIKGSVISISLFILKPVNLSPHTI